VMIGTNATYDAGWLLTTHPWDFFTAFPWRSSRHRRF
jgi:hypothetical protein